MMLRNLWENVQLLRNNNVPPDDGSDLYLVHMSPTAYRTFLSDPDLLPTLAANQIEPNMFATEFPCLGFRISVDWDAS